MTVQVTTHADALPAIAPLDPLDGFELLTKYEAEPSARPDFIACISAGYKTKEGVPQASRDGTIYISDADGRAPGLAAALAETDGKTLTIALPSDRLSDVLFQHYRKEGRSRLEAYGDAKGITEIGTDGKRTFHPAGSAGFKRLVEDKATKVNYQLAFFLARWAQGVNDSTPRPELVWPDGVGVYRLRSTSRHTAENLIACVRQLAALTGGPVAGFPLEVRIVYPQRSDPTGAKRAAPNFAFVFKLPGGLTLDAGQFRSVAAESAAILPSMAIAALPPAQTVDEAIEEFQLLAPPMDANECRKGFFGILGKTHWGTEEGRKEFLLEYTGGKTGSLKTWLETASVDDMHALLDAAEAKVATEAAATGADRETGEVIEVVGELVDDDPPAPPADDSNEPPTSEQLSACNVLVKTLALTPDQGKAILWKLFEKEGRSQLNRGEMTRFINHLDGLAKASQKEEGDA